MIVNIKDFGFFGHPRFDVGNVGGKTLRVLNTPWLANILVDLTPV